MKEIICAVMELIAYIVGLVVCFLFIGHTTINSTFPYIHMEYPIRAIVTLVLILVVGIIGTLIKH